MAPEMDAEAAASPQSLSGVRKGSDTCARCASTPKVSSHEFFFLQSACIHGGYKKKKKRQHIVVLPFCHCPRGPYPRAREVAPKGAPATQKSEVGAFGDGWHAGDAAVCLDLRTWPRLMDVA